MNVSLVLNITQLRNKEIFVSALTRNIIVVGLCISINYINGTLVHTFIKHEALAGNPRYILFIHMVLNDMMQLTMTGLLHLLSSTVSINVSFCCVLIISVLYMTLNTPLNLAVMAIERYIAICKPFRHVQICTVRNTYLLIGLIWIMSSIQVLPDLCILLATHTSTFFYSDILCIRDNLFQNPVIIQKRIIVYLIYLSFVWATLVYTYLKILHAAKAVNSDAGKARRTITLHGVQLLMCMLTFVGPFLERVMANVIQVTAESQFVSYLVIQILPRFISPIVYGLRDQTFSHYLKRYLLCTRFQSENRIRDVKHNLPAVSY